MNQPPPAPQIIFLPHPLTTSAPLLTLRDICDPLGLVVTDQNH